MLHSISIVVHGSTVRQSSDNSILMPLSLVYYTKISMFDLKSKRIICPSIQGKHERLAFLIDIDEVNNILFLDKKQEELVMLAVLSITSIFQLNHCFMLYCVFQFKTKKKITAIYMHPYIIG